MFNHAQQIIHSVLCPRESHRPIVVDEQAGLRYVLSLPGTHVAVCGAGTLGQMQDNIRTVQSLRKMTPEEMEDVRKRALVGSGVQTGPGLDYWKKTA